MQADYRNDICYDRNGREILKADRSVSAIIYSSHLIFFSVYAIIFLKNPNKWGMDSFIVSLMLSILNAVLLIKIQRCSKFGWIKHIL